MKLLELIGYLKNADNLDELLSKEIPNVEFDLIELYMVNKIDLESEIFFFDAETIPNNLEIEVDGIKYVNLFPLYMAQELVEEIANLNEGKNTNLAIANRLLEYGIKDA